MEGYKLDRKLVINYKNCILWNNPKILLIIFIVNVTRRKLKLIKKTNNCFIWIKLDRIKCNLREGLPPRIIPHHKIVLHLPQEHHHQTLRVVVLHHQSPHLHLHHQMLVRLIHQVHQIRRIHQVFSALKALQVHHAHQTHQLHQNPPDHITMIESLAANHQHPFHLT